MKLGIIGLAGVGKATIFQALTDKQIDPGLRAENQFGAIRVPDDRVDTLARFYETRKTVYAQVEYLLPGIGASKSDGPGDQAAWTQVRDCDAVIHVVRNFSAYGLSDPDADRDFHALEQELILADLMVVEKRLERLEQDKRRGKQISEEELALLKESRQLLEDEVPLRNNPQIASAPALRGFAFLSAKPTLVLFNNADEDEELPGNSKLAETVNCMVIRGKLEEELGQMSPEEAAEFLTEFNINASAKDRVLQASYRLLGLISFFTAGEKEVHVWTIPENTPAVQAAGAIHSDMEKGFIRAEVVSYDDLMAAGSYAEARKAGNVRLEGKTYPVKDGDIIVVRFNV
jgi:ribosome-binding ATPase